MEFTHFNEAGLAKMVDVGEKKDTDRIAVAKGSIILSREVLEKVKEGSMKKGDVISVAQVAGIMGAKKTADIIPMCHNIFITGVDLSFEIDEERSAIDIEAVASTIGKTGIEMEALHAVSVAALTIYDMCKAVDKNMVIENIRLIRKEGGKSGVYQRQE
ncbi:MAG: cyclic pyranopterin monophosphate synthase MoaC [Firmicutes bacterium]|jgi:cyclic pyranopterin phosphate synthase|nr:cyclic pyranopterin monophosphate synthase MoaC [Bacillota bacterium]